MRSGIIRPAHLATNSHLADICSSARAFLNRWQGCKTLLEKARLALAALLQPFQVRPEPFHRTELAGNTSKLLRNPPWAKLACDISACRSAHCSPRTRQSKAWPEIGVAEGVPPGWTVSGPPLKPLAVRANLLEFSLAKREVRDSIFFKGGRLREPCHQRFAISNPAGLNYGYHALWLYFKSQLLRRRQPIPFVLVLATSIVEPASLHTDLTMLLSRFD